MTGAEQIPEKIRRGYANQPAPDNGEDAPSRFEDDGAGICLNCRRSKFLHYASLECMIGTR